jgi:competence protein ComEA
MTAGRIFNRWSILAGVLVIIIMAGSLVIGLNYRGGQLFEIIVHPAPTPEGQIYIGGEVNNPGIYPFYASDSLEDILHAAGGVTDNADLSHIVLNVPGEGSVAEVQKININTAGAWLLAALPGIGEARAGAIIAYRTENGPFRDINELLNVPGIGEATLENIRDLVTVAD